MMPIQPGWWDMIVFALLTIGFAALALTNRHASAILLGRGTTSRESLAFNLLGWPLIGLTLILCVIGWRAPYGTIMWFCWMTVAALLVVFAVTYWPGRKNAARNERVSSQPADPAVAPSRKLITLRIWQAVLLAGIVAVPSAFFWSLRDAEVQPVLRPDAVHGQVGPWTFILSEEEQGPPEIIGQNTPVKHLVLRFCEACDAQIRAAYIKAREPRSPAGLGLRFTENRAAREVMVSIPPAATPEDGFWLSVVGHDHKTHRTRIDIARLSPGTADYLRQKQP